MDHLILRAATLKKRHNYSANFSAKLYPGSNCQILRIETASLVSKVLVSSSVRSLLVLHRISAVQHSTVAAMSPGRK